MSLSKPVYAVMGLAFVASVFISASYAIAQQEQEGSAGYLISPVRVEMTVDVGESETTTLTIENVTDVPTTATAIVNNFGPSADESGQPAIDFDSTINYGNNFVPLVDPIEPVKLAPNEKVEVDVVISVPQDASPGGYYGVVRFASSDDQGDTNVALSASVGTIFLVTVPGELNEALELVELSAAKSGSTGRFFIGGGEDIEIVTRLHNSGNIHLQPFGKISVADSKGNEVESFELQDNTQRDNVLPGSTRKYVNELEYDGFFGKYTVTANLGYGNEGSLITAKNTFWVVPVWLVVVAVLGILALLVAIFLIYKKVSNKTAKKHKVQPRR